MPNRVGEPNQPAERKYGAQYKLIGKDYPTPDLYAKVTGKAKYGEDRFTLVKRFIGKRSFSSFVGFDHDPKIREAVGRSGEVVRRQNRFDAGHRQRLAQIDVVHAPMRHRAEQELAEQHALRAEVLSVLRLPCDFRIQVGRLIVFAD